VRILLAEDEPLTRHLVTRLLEDWGYSVEVAHDGVEALDRLRAPTAARLAILDWMMPGADGIDVCRQVRSAGNADYTYLILLTAKRQKEDVVAGLDAGADDYVTKPFDEAELHSRVRAGERILSLKGALAEKVGQLEAALEHVQRLQGLLPICMHCKKIRDDSHTWHRMETYIEEHSDAMFSHALCDDCLAKYYSEDSGPEEEPASEPEPDEEEGSR